MAFLKDLKVRLGLDNSNFKTGLEDSKKDVNVFSGAIKKVGGVIAAAFAVKAVVEFGKELFNLGSKAEGVRQAFKKIGGEPYLQGLRDAVKGTVSDVDLMKQAVQANNFDIPVKNLAGLFEFARRRAKGTGEAVDYLTQSIVTGIGRKSPLILDNLGISAAQLSKELNGASMASASVGEITAAVERIAGKALKNMADDTSTADERTVGLKTAWTNLKTTVGETLVGLNTFFVSITKGLNGVISVMNDEVLTAWEKWQAILFRDKNLLSLSKYNEELKKQASLVDWAILSEKELQAEKFKYQQRANISKELKGWEAYVRAIDDEFDAREKNAKAIALEKEELRLKNIEEAKALKLAAQEKATTELRKETAKEISVKRPKETVKVGVSIDPETQTLALGQDLVKIAASLPKIPIDLEISSLNRENIEGLEGMTAAEERTAEFVDKMADMAEDFKNSAVAGFSDGMQLMTDAMFTSEKFDAGAMISALLTPLADMAIRTGEICVGIGLSIEAVKKSLFTLTGFPAIAAGVALIAIGATAKSLLGAAARGKSGGGTSSRNSGSGLQAIPVTGGSSIIQGGESVTGLGSQQAVIPERIVLEVSGDNLIAVLDKNTKRNKSY